MALKTLKTVRVVVSLAFFVATALVFLDFLGVLPPGLIRGIVYLQFTPSLFNFVVLAGTGAFGFVVAIALGLIIGRVYCSTICPLGTLQDIISYLSRKLGLQKYHEPLQPFASIHLAFLIVTALPVIVGSLFAVTLLDPFSNFGRIAVNLVKPIILVANNALSSLLQLFDRYDIYPVEIKGLSLIPILVAVAFLVLIAWMSARHGRLYCNSICPVGSLLRLASRYSLLRIAIDDKHCKSCQLCQRVCKAGCIDRKRKTVDFERCVACYNCFAACPSGGLKYFWSFQNTNEARASVDSSRRSFLMGWPLLFVSPGIAKDTIKVVKPQKESTIPERKQYAVTPPGSLSLSHFTETCTGCHLCISACPPRVLQPSLLQYGLAGLLQPTMDFDTSYCTFDCTACTEVCPSGALRKLTLEEKKVSQAGRAVFIKENCVVFTENTDCGACTEHCPTKAVTMVPYKNSRLPEVHSEYCIGCGACEHACPTRPYRAIYVDGNRVHLIAKKKEPDKRQEIKFDGDFPF